MASDFEKAFRKLDDERQVAQREMEELELEERRLKSLAQTVAESYLLSIAPATRQKLIELNIPFHGQSSSPSKRGWFKRNRLDCWSFPTYRRLNLDLHLTHGGYFVVDSELPGPEGFAALIRDIRMARNGHAITGPYDKYGGKRLRQGEVFVNEATHRLLIHHQPVDSDPEYFDLSEWLALSVRWQNTATSK